MNTITINPAGNSSSKKNVATHAATAAAAAGLGAAATAMASEIIDGPDPIDNVVGEIHTPNAEHPNQSQNNQSNAGAGSANTASANGNTTNSGTSNAAVSEPEPLTDGGEDVVEIVEQQNPQQSTPDNATHTNAETVNPNEIAEAIIAEDQIDPNDIDMADVINFDEIGTVYTVEGESYTAAAFHDGAGNQLLMVDVDGDNVFDVITDMDCNLITDEQGNVLAAGDMTVDDAEIGIAGSQTYLAANDTEDFGSDSLAEDILA